MRDVNVKLTLSLDKAIKILNCFSFDHQYLTIDTICKLVNIPKTTAYRLLYTLEANGLVHYNSEDATYSLGMKMFEYGGIVLGRLNIRKIASPYITALHHKSGCSVTLSILEGDRLVYIDKCESTQGIGYTSTIGRAREPHFGSPGRVFMAYMDKSKVERILKATPLKRYTEATIIDKEQFLEELEKIREQGYGVDFDEITVGAGAVAAPVRDRWNQIAAVVTVVGPRETIMDYPPSRLAQDVCECARQISVAMGSTSYL